ncbi:MAG: hypothetical protein CMK59_12975 [Proteobacteria bacterium]|nr:hypothetical protein [Pseudomonadota bacterium]
MNNPNVYCLLVVFLGGCSGNDVKPNEPSNDVQSNGESTETGEVEQDNEYDVEVCDGLDNDGDGVVDNGLEFQHYWLDRDNDGYGGPTGFNCSDLMNEGREDGVYEIWPSGRDGMPLTVRCDLTTDGGGWTLVFFHDIAGGYFTSHEDAYHNNEEDPDAHLYSILKHLEHFRDSNGMFELRMNWPDTEITGSNIWRQFSNPTTAPVVGYEEVNVSYLSQYWAGLELSTSNETYLDGSVQHVNWFYAIGSHVPYLEGIPSYGPASNRVALWVRAPAVNGVEMITDCKQPSGYTDVPGDCDDGDEDISPTAEDVCNGIDDDCDHQTDIGCPYGDIEITSGPKALQFYARDRSSNTCELTVQGNGLGAAEQVQLKVFKDGVLFSESSQESEDFALTATIEAGLFRYDAQISWDSNSGYWTKSKTFENIVCGDVILLNGQSNTVASDYHGEQLGDLEKNNFVRSFGGAELDASMINDVSFGIAAANIPHVHASIGQWGLRMANLLSTEESIPILVLNGAVGGSSVWSHLRNESYPIDLNTIYGRLLWRVQQAELTEAVRAIVWHQGEADGTISFDDYLYLWTLMYSAWIQDYPNLEGVYVMQVRNGCGDPTWSRNVHRELPGLLDKVIGHMSTTGVDGHDGCHFFHQSYAEWGERMARLLRRDFYGANYGPNIEAPDPIGATWLSSTELQIDFGDSGNGLFLEPGAQDYFSLSDGVEVSLAEVVGTTVVLTTVAPSQASWVSFVDAEGDIPWLKNELGIGSFAWYELPITE